MNKNLVYLCNRYLKLLKFGKYNNDIINKYIRSRLYDNFECNGDNLPIEHINEDWIPINVQISLPEYLQALAKLSPINYNNNKISYASLIYHQNKQMELYECLSIHMINDNYIKKIIEDFDHFIKMHKHYPQNIIIPTEDEDFVWHSFLLNNKDYLDYTEKILGKPLDHIFHLDYQDKKYNSDIIRNKYNEQHRPYLLPEEKSSWDGCG